MVSARDKVGGGGVKGAGGRGEHGRWRLDDQVEAGEWEGRMTPK